MRLQEKVCIITGSGSGMGRMTAQLFAREGALVIIAELNETAGNETVELITNEGGKAAFVKVDVSNEQSVQEMVQASIKQFGKIDTLFNNAGISGRPFGDSIYIADVPEEAWQKVIDINLKGVYLCCKHTIPEMVKNGGGAIVNTSSLAGISGGFPPGSLGSELPLPNPLAYTAAKGGVVSLSKSIVLAYGPKNIRCNVIAPGVVNTELMKPTAFFKEEYQATTEKIFPLGTYATAEDIAYAALYLSSDESSYVSGQVLAVDGGYSAY